MNMPKSRDIQAKIPLPQAIWNFGYVTVNGVNSNHEYFQVSGVSKSRLTDNIEKRIIIIKGGISHTNACVGGVGNGSDERLCCPSG